jgi:spore coat protein H
MDKFHLANSVQDPSYLSELLCGEMFRAAGVPASRVSHAVVTINGRKCGMYYLKEGYDRYFLKRHFKDIKGNLYDGGFLRDVDQPLQLLTGRDDVKDRADLKALTAAVRENDPKKRFEKLDKVLDMDKFITYLVLEVITWDWDGYPMNRNNYRIYHDKTRDKLVFIPSGMDQMFGNPGGPILPGFQGMVANAVINTPEGKKRYYARMAAIREKVFQPDALIKRLDALQARVQPALTAIDKGAGNGFPGQVNRLRDAIRQRAKSIDQHLKKA